MFTITKKGLANVCKRNYYTLPLSNKIKDNLRNDPKKYKNIMSDDMKKYISNYENIIGNNLYIYDWRSDKDNYIKKI